MHGQGLERESERVREKSKRQEKKQEASRQGWIMRGKREGERGKVPQEGNISYICLFGIHLPCCLSEGSMVCT